MEKSVAIIFLTILSLFDAIGSSPIQDSDGSSSDSDIDENGLLQGAEYEDWGDMTYNSNDSVLVNKSVQARDMMMPMRSSSCFPGKATVLLDSGETVSMHNLRKGQKVLTATDGGELIYSEVVTFLKRVQQISSLYVMLETHSATISLTEEHVIFVTNANGTLPLSSKFAGDVMIGDWVLVSAGDEIRPETVNHIHKSTMTGAYVPLTEHGTIIVDGILASCYASFDHWLANLFLAPLRWWPSLFGVITADDDMPAYVYAVKEIGHFVVPSLYQNRIPGAALLFPVS